MVSEPAVARVVEMRATKDSSRFCELFESYQSALRRLASAYVERPADREDLLQDIAVGIWQSLPRFRGDCSERTWIYRIAHNIAIRASSRVRTRRAREPIIENRWDRQSPDSSSEELLLIEEKRKAMMKRIRELSALDRQLVILHLEGLSAIEIEEVTGVSQGAIATRLTRVRQRLASRLKMEGY